MLLLGTFVPCYLAASTIGGFRTPGLGVDWFWLGAAVCCNVLPLATWVARSRVQEAYNIREDCATRFLCWCACGTCQLCQDAREVRIRRKGFIGLDDTVSEQPLPQPPAMSRVLPAPYGVSYMPVAPAPMHAQAPSAPSAASTQWMPASEAYSEKPPMYA